MKRPVISVCPHTALGGQCTNQEGLDPMESSSTTQETAAPAASKRNEILIAVLGLIGVLITGVLSNWDKLFPPSNVVTSTFSGYQPTGNPQIELRYLSEITGMRDRVKQMQAGILEQFRKQAEAKLRDNPEIVANVFKIVEEEVASQYDESMNLYVPIASKYLSVAEIQELNKFYSTPVMREMLRKQPLINEEFLSVVMQNVGKEQERLETRINEVIKAEISKEDAKPKAPSQ